VVVFCSNVIKKVIFVKWYTTTMIRVDPADLGNCVMNFTVVEAQAA